MGHEHALRKLHAQNMHAMISVWAKLDPSSRSFQEMRSTLLPAIPAAEEVVA